MTTSALTTMAVLMISAGMLVQARSVEGPPPSDIEIDLDPIDICIFSCDMCYKGESLVNCANECINTEAGMAPPWIHTCKFFSSGAGLVLQAIHHQFTHHGPLKH